MTRVVPMHVVDAFASEPFAGNPAAVCLLDEPAQIPWMQQVAAEMRHSETAFVAPSGESAASFSLRWFTPTVEVELCGHATLAAAHVLWDTDRVGSDEMIAFDTAGGRLRATRTDFRIDVDFPARPAKSCERPAGLAKALGTYPSWVGHSEENDLLAELQSAETVRRLTPDLTVLARLGVRGVIVTSISDDAESDTDFISRFFAPAVGIDEDPVTGAAHCTLGPFWAERLGRDELIGYQASARGGIVRVRVNGDRVAIGGDVRTVLRGEIEAPAGDTPPPPAHAGDTPPPPAHAGGTPAPPAHAGDTPAPPAEMA